MGVLETQLLQERMEALALELEQKQEQVEQLQTQAVSMPASSLHTASSLPSACGEDQYAR